MNEWYAKDVSKKIRSAYKAKAQAGKFTGAYPPYGYLKDPKDKHYLIIDEEVKDIIIQIFTLAKEGKSAYQIASILKKKKVLKPSAFLHQRTGRYFSRLNEIYPYDWAPNTIRGIISKQEYIGNLVCNKHSTISFKSKNLLKLSEDKWIITKGTHEPINDKELFESANKVFYGIIKRKEKTGPMNLFTGMLKCGTCGKNLAVSKPKHRKEAFCCGTYRQFGKEYCSSHYLRYITLYGLVLEDIKNHIKVINISQDKFVEEYLQKSNKENEKSNSQKNKEIKKMEYRLNELKQITKKLYEDVALGRMENDLYHRFNLEYTEERNLLQDKLNTLKNNLSEQKA